MIPYSAPVWVVIRLGNLPKELQDNLEVVNEAVGGVFAGKAY